MHILDQSIPYLNLYILSPLTLFAELFETKSDLVKMHTLPRNKLLF